MKRQIKTKFDKKKFEAKQKAKIKAKKKQDLQTKMKKKIMIQALESKLGIVTSACKDAKIGRATHYRWIEEDASYKKSVESIGEKTLDVVENALLKNIVEGNIAGQIFYLKTKGKNRGYIEKQEVEMSGSMDNDIKVSVVKVIKKEEEFDGTESNDNIPTE